MPWICPTCSGENNAASLRCPCGYEIQETLISKKRSTPRPRGFTVLALFFIILAIFAAIEVKSTAPTNTFLNKLFNSALGISLISTSMGLLKFRTWAYKAFQVSVGITVTQMAYILLITERQFQVILFVITLGYVPIFYFIGKYIQRTTSKAA